MNPDELKACLYIDCDGFPNVELAIQIVSERGARTIIAGNMTQNLGRFEGVDGIEVVEVSDGRDEADFAILNRIKSGDILLTNDTGLAAIALAKGAVVLNARGKQFREETIDERLMARHGAAKARRGGRKSKGPQKLRESDRERFAEKLKGLLESV